MKNQLFNMRPNYHGLNQLISHVTKQHNPQNYTLIEIGAYSGQSTIFFAKFFKQVITIDPFINDYDVKDPTCKFMPLQSVYTKFLDNIQSYKNILHIHKISDEAIQDIINMKLDNILMVYIDGLHTYEQVNKDIINYKGLIISDGYLCGHDYHTKQWKGVCDAIDNFKKPDMVFADTSWLIERPNA